MLAKNTSHPLSDIPASFTVGPKWFVFYTHIQSEKLASDSISALGFPVFVPFEKRILRRPNRKPRLYETALFSRYGFVQFDVNDDSWGAIRHAKGVSEILSPGGVPRHVPSWAIDGLKLASTVGVFDRTKPPSIGMPVEVTDGPFSSLIGKIKRARSGERMEVILNFLGGEVSTVIPLSHLREV